MKYIKNTGRYAVSFEITKENGRQAKIILDKRRIYLDTGNVATTGITAVEDKDYEALCKLKRFNKLVETKELFLISEEEANPSSETEDKLRAENEDLKKQLQEVNEKAVNKEAKEKIKTQEKEIKDLKAQLEALKGDKKEDTESTENTEADTEGF